MVLVSSFRRKTLPWQGGLFLFKVVRKRNIPSGNTNKTSKYGVGTTFKYRKWHRSRAADIVSGERPGDQKRSSSVPGGVRSRMTQFPSCSDTFCRSGSKAWLPPGSRSVGSAYENICALAPMTGSGQRWGLATWQVSGLHVSGVSVAFSVLPQNSRSQKHSLMGIFSDFSFLISKVKVISAILLPFAILNKNGYGYLNVYCTYSWPWLLRKDIYLKWHAANSMQCQAINHPFSFLNYIILLGKCE